jgi:hypothetical protein
MHAKVYSKSPQLAKKFERVQSYRKLKQVINNIEYLQLATLNSHVDFLTRELGKLEYVKKNP